MKMTMTGTGDSILIQGYPDEGYPGLDRVRDFIARGQARFGNLETCVTDWDTYCSAYSGGTWMNTDKRVLRKIVDFGFNFLGFANNHTLDLGPDGLLETLENVRDAGVAVAGAGKDLGEASQPVYRDLPGGRVAFIAVSATFNDAARAGYATRYLKGRPGLNGLRHKKEICLSREHFDLFRDVADATGINASVEISRATGFTPPLAEGTAEFGGLSLRISPDGREYVRTSCNKKDLERILASVHDARYIADYVVVMIHSHDISGKAMTQPAAYMEEFCRAVIDGGADAVFGGGTHQLKPVEIYRGKPIFYSLGNFCFQSNLVEKQPADMLDKYGLDDVSGARALAARNKEWTIGQHTQKENFLTVIPLISFEDGKLESVDLMPVSLGFDKPRTFKGIPYPAERADADEIFSVLTRISAQYGTKLEQKSDGVIAVKTEA
ncbi:MAG: CapA family protein [Clostridia bacterium]|nr:CapA family protein [Clostridia bacterium]